MTVLIGLAIAVVALVVGAFIGIIFSAMSIKGKNEDPFVD